MQAAPPPEPINAPIVVTARALPDPAVERAFDVVVIDGERLKNSPSTQLDQILKDVPGLQLFRRSDARSGHPTSQGVTLRSLGGTASSRVLLVLDGVPQSDPFGGWINWPAYDPASLAEVRVVRGGGSVANGPGALAGTIEMRSRLAEGFDASVEAGSRDSSEGRLFGGFGFGRGAFAVSGRAARGDGFTPITSETLGPADRPAPYNEASARVVWAAPLSGPTEIQLSGLGFTDRRERGTAFTENRTDGADGAMRLVGRGPWQWSLLGYAQWRELESSFASVSPGRTAATQVSLQDSVPSNAWGGTFEVRPPIGGGIELRLGGDVRRTEGESRELFTYVAGQPTRRRRAGGETLTGGLFGEATGEAGRLTLSGGFRIDRWRIFDGELVEHVIASGAVLRDEHYPSRSGWRPTARASAIVNVRNGLDLTSAAYLGWRLPTLNELFRPFRVGADATAANPLLDPERLAGFEVGARYRHEGLSLSATAFANRLRESIANVTLGHGPGVFPGVGFVAASGEYRQRQNLDAVRVRGIELSGELHRGSFSFTGGASFADAEVQSDGPAAALDGLRPAQTPKLSLTGGLSWDKDGRSLSLIIQHVSPQFEDDLNIDQLPGATTIDAFAAWPIGRDVQIFARGENLLDKLVIAGIGGDGSVERATPRTLWLGIRLNRGATE